MQHRMNHTVIIFIVAQNGYGDHIIYVLDIKISYCVVYKKYL